MYPPLEKDHQVLGKEYCSGYADSYGKWNTGFYCPPMSPDSATIFCCGTADQKYCCSGVSQAATPKPIVEMETEMEFTNDYDPPVPGPDIGRNSYVAAVICGLVVVTVLMTLASCFYCSCCLLYKKRRAQLPGGLDGLYRIPASSTTSTTCGLINSATGATTPNSLVTSPMNPVFTSADSWGLHTLQGQLARANPPQPPPPNQRPNLNPTLNDIQATIQSTLRYHQQPPSLPPGNSNASRLLRQISLLQRQNPNLILRNGQPPNNVNNNSTIPTIYTTGGRSSTNGTMSSLISSVSCTSSNSSLPPPYFVEQYRIRNRVRQPRNPTPAVLLPSYNDIQRQGPGPGPALAAAAPASALSSNVPVRNTYTNGPSSGPPLPSHQQQPQSQNSQSVPQPSRSRSPSTPPCTMMNDLSAPPRRRNSQADIRNGQIIQVSNLPVSPMSEDCQPPRDKILNTSIQSESARRENVGTSSDTRRLQEALEEIRRKPSTASRSRIKSQPQAENVRPKSESVSLSVEPTALRSNQAHAN